MPRLMLSLLGPFQAYLDAQPLNPFGSTQAAALLAYLALEAERPHARTSLAALLWPEDDERSATKNLRQVLYLLRQRIGDGEQQSPYLLINRETIQFNIASDSTVDVAQFLRLVKQQRFADAMAIYTGDLLAGFDSESSAYGNWLSTAREHLHQLALDALARYADAAMGQQNFAEATLAARRQLAMEPWHESAHRQLMQALSATGDRAAALEQYARCQQILREELGIDPSPDTVVLYQDIRESRLRSTSSPSRRDAPAPPTNPAHPFAGVPETPGFVGRVAEQTQLWQWLIATECRLVGVLGMGGMGKTTLIAHAICTQLRDGFEQMLWFSLLNAPLLDDFIAEAINTLTGHGIDIRSTNVDQRLALLLEQMRRRRILLVLDNMETVLADPEEEKPTGAFRSGYEGYGQLLRTAAQHEHRSCLLFTSRQRPQGMGRLMADSAVVQSLVLGGIDVAASRTLLNQQGLAVSGDTGVELSQRYSGNPLALKLIADVVQSYFDGDFAAFLAEEGLIIDDVRQLLDEQFTRLTLLEKEVMIWLAIERTPQTLQSLQAKRLGSASLRFLLEAVRGLERRALLEQSAGAFFLQNVITEYVTDYVVDTVCAEIADRRFDLLASHALLDTEALAYVRQSQLRLLHRPILHRLTARLGEERLGRTLLELIESLRLLPQAVQGYGPGNLLNLLVLLHVDLRGQNFSGLSIHHVELTEALLPGVDFSDATFSQSTFIHTFSNIISLAYSPDGSLLAGGTFNSTIHLWHTDNWEPVATLSGHTNWVNDLEFSADSKLLASASSDGTIRLWHMATMTTQLTIHNPDGVMIGVAFHPNGQLLATVSETGMVRIWQTSDGTLMDSFPTAGGESSTPIWHPNGDLLLTAENGAAIAVWDPKSRKRIGLLEPHKPNERSVALSPDGAVVVGSGPARSIVAWDFIRRAHMWQLTGHTDEIIQVRYGWDGRWVATCSTDRTVRIWDIAEQKLRHTLEMHEDFILGLATHPSRNEVASGGNDHMLGIWDAERGRLLRLLRGYAGQVSTVAYSPDGYSIANGTNSGQLNLWAVETGETLWMQPRAHEHGIYAVAYSPDGKLLATSNAAGETIVQIWHVESRRLVRRLGLAKGRITSIAFSPDGFYLAGAASGDQTIHVWDVHSGRLVHTLHGHTDHPYGVAYSPDGTLLASTAADCSVRLWNARRGEVVCVIQAHAGWGRCVAFHPTRPLLASGGDDRKIRLWTVPGGEPIAVLSGHEAQVRSLAFLPDGNQIVSASYDGTLRLWDVDTGETVRVFLGHRGFVMSVAVSPDGRQAVSGSFDETVRIWDLHSGDCLRVLRGERPYEGMNIACAKGLSPVQIASLKELGAVEHF